VNVAAAHPWKTGPLGPRTCREIADTGKAVLFDRAVQLGTNGKALDTIKNSSSICTQVGDAPKEERSAVMQKHISHTPYQNSQSASDGQWRASPGKLSP